MSAPGTAAPDPEDTDVNFVFAAVENSGRLTLSRAELLRRLTTLIQTCEGCERVRVVDVMPLARPDAAGCNWSTTLVLETAGVAPEVYALAYAQVIVTAREGWNLQ
ncbi:MAG TPA: hypothetical protein VFJ70_07060 [Burkholderiales bacterium]|nr:hypothetical protein [Burkholderiales bacterium]